VTCPAAGEARNQRQDLAAQLKTLLASLAPAVPASANPSDHPRRNPLPSGHTRLCAPTNWRGEAALAPIY